MIYVDQLISCLPNRQWRWNRVSHMFTDPGNLLELHVFALALGLRRHWFQKTVMPHYDLMPDMRKRAVALGAVPVNRAEMVGRLRCWKLARKENQEAEG